MHLAVKTVFKQQGQQAGVIDMRMGQKHIVDFRRQNGKRFVFKRVFSLFHAVVDQQMFVAGRKIGAAARDLMRRAEKCHFHGEINSCVSFEPQARVIICVRRRNMCY